MGQFVAIPQRYWTCAKPILTKITFKMNTSFLTSVVLAVLAFVSQSFGLYLGQGGVVGRGNITPRTGSSFPSRAGAGFSTSGRSRSRDYGVRYTNGYRPSGIRPSSSKGRR